MKTQSVSIFVLAILFYIGTIPIHAETQLKQQPSIQQVLQAMAKGDGISEKEAETISLEIWSRLWGGDLIVKVQSCKETEDKQTWEIRLWADQPLEGAGCVIQIRKTGSLQKIEYVMGT